ncbi:MAG: sugar phosphate isomerase [Anaerocolumna sp.]|jgi:sugar phosphate isomerase/epimerase|nr:sugar phosphate isomerase [Anaerocolumna sp.]
MKKIKLAAPLYILRKECEIDLYGVLKRLKEMGFDGVEFLGFFGKDPIELHNILEELELEAIGNHVDYNDFLKNPEVIIKIHKEVGCSFITVTGLNKEDFTVEDKVKEYLKNVESLGKQCKSEGLTLLYHNHDKELQVKKNNSFYLEEVLDKVSKEFLSFEPDLGWIAIGGGDPGYFLDKYLDRCPIIHLKDYYALDTGKIGDLSTLGENKGDANHSYFEFRPVGYGILNFPLLLNKIKACKPIWLLADHDLSYERDSYSDLKISLEYMKNLVIM